MRTLRTYENLLELENALKNIKYDILGISEMRRLDEKIEEYTDYILYQKGKIAGQYGVGFLIKRHLRQYIQEIIGISDRLAILNMKLPNYKKTWSIIQVYLLNKQNFFKQILDLFYEDLALTIQKYMDNYIILMGDFNAQVGARLNPDEYILGTFGHEKRSRNGQRLVEFLMEHNLVILNSIFKKKPNSKWTWISPDGTYKNEIDYIITDHTKVFTDINVITKLNFNTNHRMKIAEISKKIKESIRKDRKTKRLKTLESHIQRTGGTKKALKELREAGKCWIPKLKRKGKPITNRTNIKELATHFFTQLYADQDRNTDKYTVNTHNLTTHITKTDPVPEILPCEVEKAIKSQKIEKSSGPDNISNELMKGTEAELTPILTNIFNSILTSGSISKQWAKSHIILIHKKGDKEDIENYRPISLMSKVYKVLAKIILDRLSPILDEQQPVEQARFRRGFSTIDHIHTVKQILEKYNEYNKNVYIAFIDYAKAFDSLSHNYIWDTLEHQRIPTIYTNIVKNIYAHSQASIQLETLGKDFPIRRGV
ncbi:unnamed protein product [Euphydryas editha]|nr:unnamed protein product [Euphydryas editha]